MKVLIACEESQAVCSAFRKKGHEAFSCDIIPCSGGYPEWHILTDVKNIFDNSFQAFGQFWTEAGTVEPVIKKWDLIIAHPPCTYLANSGVQHLHKDKSRWDKLEKAIEFFMMFYNFDADKICIENPVPHKYARLPKYNQIIQPYYFGHEVMKKTCLWLKNLPLLIPTNIVSQGKKYIGKNGKSNGSEWYQLTTLKDRSKLRSKTFQGIANAMAEQWG